MRTQQSTRFFFKTFIKISAQNFRFITRFLASKKFYKIFKTKFLFSYSQIKDQVELEEMEEMAETAEMADPMHQAETAAVAELEEMADQMHQAVMAEMEEMEEMAEMAEVAQQQLQQQQPQPKKPVTKQFAKKYAKARENPSTAARKNALK
jgi:tRNA G26 N,N-dimethylase Trm1